MEQVTSPTLQSLEAQMSRLIKSRNVAVEAAENMIARANRDFDRVAIPLGREINKLRAALNAKNPPATVNKQAAKTTRVLEGLDDDEQEYYRQLANRRQAKND